MANFNLGSLLGGRSNLGGRRGGKFRWPLVLLAALGAAFYYFTNLEEVPLTGRKQLRTMDVDEEMQLGLQSYQQILDQSQLAPPGPRTEKVKRIGADIARAAQEIRLPDGSIGIPDADEFAWEYNLIQSDQANAFALPGGYTAMYTGILPIAANDDGVAVIMGHEVAHALAHHGAERMAMENIKKIVGAGVAMGAGGMDYGGQRAVMGVFGGISSVGFSLPFSRKHESEADEIGLMLVAKACYNPNEAPKLWQRMSENSGATPPEFQSTHPAPETRIADFIRLMPRAVEIYNANCQNKIVNEYK